MQKTSSCSAFLVSSRRPQTSREFKTLIFTRHTLLSFAAAFSLFASGAVAAEDLPPTAAPPSPDAAVQHYIYEKDWSYGYQRLRGEEELRSAKPGTPLVMVSYTGQQGEEYNVAIEHDYAPFENLQVSCHFPCSVANIKSVSGPVVLRIDTVVVASTSLLGAILADAINGRLLRFGQPAPGSHETSQDVANRLTNSALHGTRPWTSTPYAIAIKNPLDPSFDCSGATSPAENLICHDPKLSAMDRELTRTYFLSQLTANDQGVLEAQARQRWEQRNLCSDSACVSAWYEREQHEFENAAHTGDIRGNQTPS